MRGSRFRARSCALGQGLLVAATVGTASNARALDVSAEIDVDAPANGRPPWVRAVASDSENAILGWIEQQPGRQVIRVARVRMSDGALLDARGFEAMQIDSTSGVRFAVGCLSSGHECLVVASDGNSSPLFGTLIDTQSGASKSVLPSLTFPSGFYVDLKVISGNSEYLLSATNYADGGTHLHRLAAGTAYEKGAGQTLVKYATWSSVAWDGTDYFVSWIANNAAKATRLSLPDLALLDPEITFAPVGGPQVGYAGGNLVALISDQSTGHVSITRVDPTDGSVLDTPPIAVVNYAPGIQLATDGTSALLLDAYARAWRLDPATGALTSVAIPSAYFTSNSIVGCGGNGYLITGDSPLQDALLRRLDDTGALLDSAPLPAPQAVQNEFSVRVACGDHECLATWFAYDASGNLVPYAARVGPGQGALDAAPLALRPGGDYYSPAREAAFDGMNYVVLAPLAGPGLAVVSAQDGTLLGAYRDPSSDGGTHLAASRHQVAILDGTIYFGTASSTYGWDLVSTSTFARLGQVSAPQGFHDAWLISDGSDFLASDTQRAVRISASGSLIDATPITFLPGAIESAVIFDGTQYVAAYFDASDHLHVARFNHADLSPLEFPGPVLADAGFRPSIAFDGSSVLVTWESGSTSDVPRALLARRLRASNGLTPLDFQAQVLSTDVRANTAGDWNVAALKGGPFVVAGNRFVRELPYDADRARIRWITSKGQGQGCSSLSECESGYCVDGVCCDSGCGGGDTSDCIACSTSSGGALDGHCGAVASPACSIADAGLDAQVQEDAGPHDGGPQRDAGAEFDSGGAADAGASLDGSTSAVEPGAISSGGGCSCDSAGRSPFESLGPFLMIFACLGLRRRRSERGTPVA